MCETASEKKWFFPPSKNHIKILALIKYCTEPCHMNEENIETVAFLVNFLFDQLNLVSS